MDQPSRVKLSGELEGDYVVLTQRGNGSMLIAPVPAGGAPLVVAMKQTCSAWPSQWEGELEDGRVLYARYRGGELSAGVGEDIEAAVKNGRSEETLYFEHVGDGLDGSMTFEELKSHLQGLLEFPEDLEVEGERDWSAEPIDGRRHPARRADLSRCSSPGVPSSPRALQGGFDSAAGAHRPAAYRS